MEYKATTDDNNNNNNKIQVSRDWNINEGKKTPPPTPTYIMLFHDSLSDKMEMAIVQA